MPNLLPIFAPFGELITDKKLADKDLLEKPILVPAQESHAFESDKLPLIFSISVQGQLSVNLFNDANDVDDLGLVGTGAEDNLIYDPMKEAYLKYDIQVFPKSKLSGTIGDIGLEINREKGIRATLYRKHDNQKVVRNAVLEDLPHFPTVFRSSDLQNLGVHDGFAYSVQGELRASGEISWSDILSKSINLFPSFFGKAMTLDLAISPKLTAKFEVSIKDHFSYFLKKNGDGSFGVSICKIKNTSLSGGIGASIGIKLGNPDVFEKQLEELLEKASTSLVDKSPSYVKKALEAIKSGQGNEVQIAVIEKIAGLFGLEDWKSKLETLEEKWVDFQNKFKKGIKESAESGAMLTFSYEFTKIKEGTEILKAGFSDSEALKNYHCDFMKFDLKPFLQDFVAAKAKGATIESYFNQKRTVTESAWGFGLKIWDREFLKGKDFKKKESIVKMDIRQHQQVSFSGVRGYEWKLGKDSGKWLSQFEAAMPSFSLALEPRVSEFEFGWTLKLFEENVHIKSPADLKGLLDTGANWGCVSARDIEWLTEKHFPTLSKQKVAFQKQVYFPDQVLKGIFQQIHHLGFNDILKKLLAKSMASSLSFQDGFALRNDPFIREKTYWPIWYYYLNHPKTSTNSLAHITANHLEKNPQVGTLAEFERKSGNNNQGVWLADLIFTQPNLFEDLVSCMAGIKILGESMLQEKPMNRLIEESYSKIGQFLGQSYYLEVLGNFLYRASAENPLAKDAVQKTLTISYGEKDDSQSIHLGVI